MNTNKNIARMVGWLYIIGTIVHILTRVVTGATRSSQDFLATISANGNPITLGALFILLNVLLYQSNLVPRWLSDWGLAGTVVAIAASCLFMVRVIDLLTSVYLDFPLALQEIVFAGWLIVKGFNPSTSLAR